MEYMQAGDPSGSCHTILSCQLSQFDQHQRKSPVSIVGKGIRNKRAKIALMFKRRE
jgi:hypothetical protein